MKQWSTWSLRTEVQRWDTCQEPTELRLICDLTESTWKPRSKSNILTPKPIRGHFDQRQLHTRWVDHLLSCVENHECLGAFLQPFSFKQKAERHVQESSGQHGSRGFGGGETDTDEFGVKEQLWRKENLPQDSSVSNSPVNQELDQSYVSFGVWKLMRNSDKNPTAYSQDRRQDDNLFSSTRALVQPSKHQEIGANWWQSNRKEKVGIPLYGSLRLSIFWEGLQESAAKVESCRRGASTQFETNVLIWWSFMSTAMTAAVHLGPNYNEHLEVFRNTNFEELKTLFDITLRFVVDHQVAILNVTPIHWRVLSWRRSTLTHDQMITWTKTKVHVYSGSILCLWKMSEHSEANKRWKNQLDEFRQPNSSRELFGIDREPIEFVWKKFLGLTSLKIFQKIRKDLKDQTFIELENFEDRTIFMSMFNDVGWTKRGNSERCVSNSEQVKNYAERFSRGHWKTLCPGDEKKWYGILCCIFLKENGIPSLHWWWDDSKKLVTQYSRASVLWVVEFWKEKVAEIPYILGRIHRTQNSCFAQFTQQISSASTHQL